MAGSGFEIPVLFALAAYIAWGIGANDETMMIAASGTQISINRLALIGAIATCIGAIAYGSIVEETIGKGILTIPASTQTGLTIVAATATWLTIVSYSGWPVSTSHSTVGAVIGYGIISGSLNWPKLNTIFLSWLLSPIIGLVSSYLIMKPLSRFSKNHGEASESRKAILILIVCALAQEFWQGANNVGNATSFLSATFEQPVLSRAFGGVFLMVGLLTLGRRVLITAGLRIARLSIVSAIGTQVIIVALNIVGTLYGLPLSGTHISIACLIGAGLATNTEVDYKMCRRIALYWLITLPGAAFFSIFFAYLPSGIIMLQKFIGYS